MGQPSAPNLLDFYQSFLLSGLPVSFAESYQVYNTTTNTYLDGALFQDYDATIASISAVPVPEPDRFSLLLAGLVGFAGLASAREQVQRAA